MMNRNADNRVAVPITTFTNWWGSERSWNITVHTEDPSRMDEAIEQHGVSSPGTPFIQKPFSAAMVSSKLRELLA